MSEEIVRPTSAGDAAGPRRRRDLRLTPDAQRWLPTIKRRLVRGFHPERIILFGSHAYGQPTADSDVDLMVVMPQRRWTRHQATDIRVRLGYAGFPMDLVVWTPERLSAWSKAGDALARDVVARGTVLYEHRRA